MAQEDNLQDEGYDLDPFLTNLARGLLTVEGTVKALSPRVNIMDAMTRHINVGFDLDSIERVVQAFLMKGVQGADDLVGLPTKAVETLDMLQKSQLKLGGDFGLDPKTVKAVNYLVRNAIFAILATALFLGACILCSAGGLCRQRGAGELWLRLWSRGLCAHGLHLPCYPKGLAEGGIATSHMIIGADGRVESDPFVGADCF